MIDATAITCLILGGIFSSYIIARPYRTLRTSKRLLKIADSAERVARGHDKLNDEVIRQFLETTRGLSLLVPAIASGELGDVLAGMSEESDPATEKVWLYLQGNSWLERYYFAGLACFGNAASIWNPFHRKNLNFYLWSWFTLITRSKADGSVLIIRDLDPEYIYTVRIAEERFKAKRGHTPVAHFAH